MKNYGVAAFALAIVAASVAAAGTSEKKRIDIYPAEVNLTSAVDRQGIIVLLTHADGITEDITSKAKLQFSDAKPARLESATIVPQAEGTTSLTASYEGMDRAVSVTVRAAANKPPISFQVDVMPVFMRGGCNTGGCHGAASGKDGFRLSLFGYDPLGDYFRLTREVGFRRVNLAVPAESLLLEKATGSVQHTGGKRFSADTAYYHTLRQWLEAGAPSDGKEVPKVESVEIYPPAAVLAGEGVTQQMIVRARYSDGTDRDVTHLAVFLSNNDNSAAIDAEGLVTAGKRGEAFVMARFDTKTVGSQFIVLPRQAAYAKPSEPPANYIDELVNAKLAKLRVAPSALCGDPTFLRRATLDIVGLLPTEDEYRQFMADKAADKRAKLVDRLLARKEFAELWAMKWAELMMIRSNNQVSYKSAYLYASWLTEQIAGGMPLDRMVREVLSASGGTFRSPATNFYELERDTLKTAENVAQVFMGLRVQCAQCHNHPFDRWTMNDYYGFAAFFSQVGRKTGEDYRETIVYNRQTGEVRHPVDGRVMPPQFLGGPPADVKGKDRRQVVADWLVSAENEYFAPSVANRIWAHFFGIGIVDPVDDIRVSNPASNPQLLETLGDKLVDYKYDFKRLVRDICNSHTYQRSSEANESNADDERNFARSRIRRIQAEMLLDAVSQATETKDKFKGLPLGARAVQIADGTTSTYFLTTFGRTPRETVCAADVKTEPTLSQALHLLNGDTLQGKIRSGGLVRRWLDEGESPAEVVRRLYVRTLSREPTADESAKLLSLLAGERSPREPIEDVFWALLNSREFLFNH